MKIQIKGIKGGVDRRGLAKFSARFLFTESTIEEAMVADLPSKPATLPETGARDFVEWDVDNDGFIIEAHFEGVVAEPKESQDQARITGEWREEPIEVFPDRQKLEDKYDAYIDPEDGRLKFPEYIKVKGSGSGLGGGSREERNPLFGVTTYPVLLLVAVHTFVRLRVPDSVYSEPGTVVKSLPSIFDDPPKRTWLVDTPDTQKRGNGWTIMRKWKEVNNLKHVAALYDLMARKAKR
jgi:hypothetical protein